MIDYYVNLCYNYFIPSKGGLNVKKAKRAEIRRLSEQQALERKAKRTGLPVQQIKKPKHLAKK